MYEVIVNISRLKILETILKYGLVFKQKIEWQTETYYLIAVVFCLETDCNV